MAPAFCRRVVTPLSLFLHFHGLMPTKVTCNTCNKSGIRKNLTECSLCGTKIHLKCNNLNLANAEFMTD